MGHFENASENELKELLLNQVITPFDIERCVQNGARLSEVIGDTTFLLELIDCLFEYDSTEFYLRHLRHLISLGANVNHRQLDGTCILGEAVMMHNDLATSVFLDLGANPNVIEEWGETILDHAEFDCFYHRTEMLGVDDDHSSWFKRMEKIVADLKRHGAKNLSELNTSQLGRWLKMFGCDKTGLLTEDGNIGVEHLPISSDLKDDFNRWKESYFDTWGGRWGKRPFNFNREEHNTWGLRIITEIRRQIPGLEMVKYLTINPNDEVKGNRNVDWQEIEAT